MTISFYQQPQLRADEPRRDLAASCFERVARGDPELDDLVRVTARRLGVPLGMVSLLRGEVQYVLAGFGVSPGAYARRQSFCGHAVADDVELFCVPNLLLDERFAGNPLVNGEVGALRFYAAALIRDAEGWALGSVCVADTRPRRELDAGERAALGDAAGTAMRRLEVLRREAVPA